MVTPAENVVMRAKGRAAIHCVHPMADFPLYDGFNTLGIRAEKSRYDLARMEPRAADWCRLPASSTNPVDNPPRNTRTSCRVFRNYRLHPQLVAFERRFRLMEFPRPETRTEFARNTS